MKNVARFDSKIIESIQLFNMKPVNGGPLMQLSELVRQQLLLYNLLHIWDYLTNYDIDIWSWEWITTSWKRKNVELMKKVLYFQEAATAICMSD